jgi:hypothetical protein
MRRHLTTRLRAIRRATTALALATLTACGGLAPMTPPPSDPPGGYVPLTRPFIAIGDTQEHEATGFPMPDNDPAIDSYVEVAQRPPEQPLFGRRVMDWVVARHPDEPLLHLGDLLDVSCWSEVRRMRQIFQTASQPLAIIPGNHDGLLFGIFNYRVDDIVRDPQSQRWDRACRNGTQLQPAGVPADAGPSNALTKRDFVSVYLRYMGLRDPGSEIAAPSGPGAIEWSWRHRDPEAFLQAIELRLTPERRYARSFLLQKLRLPSATPTARRVSIIGMDTNQLNVLVGTLDAIRGVSPGNVGHMYQFQFDAIERLVEESRRAGEIVVFAGHHDWRSIAAGTRLQLSLIMAKLDHPLVYLSAHTHSGFWQLHEVSGRKLLELNVSSLSDWPVAYRRISFEHDAQANRIKVVAQLMPSGGPGREATSDGALFDRWKDEVCAKAGVPVEAMERRDRILVARQRSDRGSLIDWIRTNFYASCEDCLALLFDNGHAYQDLMLAEIRQTRIDLGRDAVELDRTELPEVCADAGGLTSCIDRLRHLEPADNPERIALFRAKAELVDRVNWRLDRMRSPRARAYMTCRAIISAKLDFDMTPESSIPWRAESYRRSGDYFRTEATVGMR